MSMTTTIPLPLILVNLKTYEAGSDAQAENLAQQCQTIAQRYKAGVALACQAADLFRLSKITSLPLFCQHVDPAEYGAHTGSSIIETMRCNGAIGTLLNHSEHRVPFEHIKAVVAKAKRLKFITVVCAKNSTEAKKISKLCPDFIAVEPPTLIGGTISVSTAQPGLITSSVKAVGTSSILLVGAGVKTAQDVTTSLKLGTKGVLVASGIVQNRNPASALKEILEGTMG